jgi:hypothetical protein
MKEDEEGEAGARRTSADGSGDDDTPSFSGRDLEDEPALPEHESDSDSDISLLRTAPPISEDEDEDDEEGEDDDDEDSAEPFGISEDPLSTAYDLDVGKPLRHGRPEDRRGLSTKPTSKVRSAKEFFSTEILYRFDILEMGDRRKIGGRYRIELKGNKGGIWTIFAGDDIEIVNRREDADLVFVMQHRDFIHMVNGDLNPQLAILAQKLKVQGELRQAVKFQTILLPYSEN